MRSNIRRILTLLSVFLVAVLIALILELVNFHGKKDDATRAQAKAITAEFSKSFGGFIDRVESDSPAIADAVTALANTDSLDEDRIETIIREASLAMPEVLGVTACFEPFAFASDRRLYCPYYDKADASLFALHDSYDYTLRSDATLWYVDVIDQGTRWTKPFYGETVGKWFIEYGVPFLDKDGKVAGMISHAFGVADLQTIVHDLAVGRASGSYVTARDGIFLAHPNSDYVGTTTIADRLADSDTPMDERVVLEALAEGVLTDFAFTDPERGSALVHISPMDGTQFSVATIFYRAEMSNDQRPLNRRYTMIALVLSLFLAIAAIRWFSRDRLDFNEIEGLSFAISAVLLVNVLFIGFLQHTLPTEHTPLESPPIVDVASLNGFVAEEQARAEALKIDQPVSIPTGIFIERMEFADSYNVNIGGVMWQRYPPERVDGIGDDDIEIGLHMPQISPFAESAYFEENSRQLISAKEGQDGYLLVNFDFRITLRLDLEYSDFPFDKRHLDIQFAPPSRTDPVILVPDLDAYASTSPARLSGIDPSIKLPGTRVVETYFNFTAEDFDTNFGVGTGGASAHLPTLHFNIHQKRYLINAFVTYLIPIGVTLALIYILILSCEKTDARQGIVESMAAFFFVLIFSHIDLRKNIETADLMFMEYFYFATYFIIILSTFNLISYTKSRVGYFDYNDNQIFRALYFPIFFGLILVVMLLRFF